MRNGIKPWWNRRLVPTLPTLQVFLGFLFSLFLIIAILVGFKYLFFTSCVSVGNVKECVSSNVDSGSTLFAIGGILIAIVALIPTFWIESKIRDAKKEVSQEIAEEVKGSMQRLSNAQMLIFEADRYNSPAALLIKEDNIQRAITLWPAFKKEEYRKLSRAYAEAVIDAFYHGLGVISTDDTIIAQTLAVHRNQLSRYIDRAIFYLEEAVLHSETADRDGLVRLACMYGCAGRYEEMIRVIESALKVDENASDDFQEPKRLSLLVRACGIDRRKIERLGKKIKKELPLSKEEFIRVFEDHRHTYGTPGDFFAITRQSNGKGHDYIVRITSFVNDDNGLRVSCQIVREFSGDEDVQFVPPLDSRSPADRLLPVEEFFNEINKQLFVICYKEA
jgi:tetratricopeptide (TPR) repeat protein